MVEIPDPVLREGIKTYLYAYMGIDAGKVITDDEMEKLTYLTIDASPVASLEGIQAAVNLEELSLNNQNISDLSPLAELTKLKKVNLMNNNITDISVLEELPALESSMLAANPVSGYVFDKYMSFPDIIVPLSEGECEVQPEADRFEISFTEMNFSIPEEYADMAEIDMSEAGNGICRIILKDTGIVPITVSKDGYEKEFILVITDENGKVPIEIDSSESAPVAALENIKGKDVDVILDMGNYQWIINGNDISKIDLSQISFGVVEDVQVIPEKEISQLADGNVSKQFMLERNGSFGFLTGLKLLLGEEYAEKYGNLYWYTEDRKWVYIDSALIDSEGYAAFVMDHASDYLVVISEDEMSEEDIPKDMNDEENPGHIGDSDESNTANPDNSGNVEPGQSTGSGTDKTTRPDQNQEDGDSKNENAPQTGDFTNPSMWLILLIGSVVCVITAGAACAGYKKFKNR